MTDKSLDVYYPEMPVHSILDGCCIQRVGDDAWDDEIKWIATAPKGKQFTRNECVAVRSATLKGLKEDIKMGFMQ